jgi:CxxC motif-containing protein (DUF1111 family)
MKNSEYQQAKAELKEVAKLVKRSNRNDKPFIRQTINDYCDMLCRDLSLSLSDARRNQYQNWLHNLAANLHPSK